MNTNNICPFCKLWAATSWRQWKIRQERMRAAPDVAVHPCPRCGGTAWAAIEPAEEYPESDAGRWLIVATVIGLAITTVIAIATIIKAVLYFGSH